MRWLYFDPSNSQEAAAHAAVVSRMDEWWKQFAAKTDDLLDLFTQRSQWDLPAWMDRELRAVSADLMWEFGPAVSENGHRLVITPETEKHLRPMVQTLLERAPKLPCYIDLALADVDSALPLIQSRLRAGNINRRTWLLFFGALLSHEWIGVYDDSPAPP
jgi:hypothetical protein